MTIDSLPSSALPFTGSLTLTQPVNSIPSTFGSAGFMNKNEAINFRLDEPGTGRTFCPYLGEITNNDVHEPAFIYARRPSYWRNELLEGNGHLLTFAPSRGGKGTGQIITNLLTWQGSVLVLDVKGENYCRSAGYRAKMMKQSVFRFAPFEKDSEIWNPLMSIRANLNETDVTSEELCQEQEDAVYLTNLLISKSGSANNAFWENSASSFLEGLLLHVRTADLSLNAEDAQKPEYEYRVRERSMREVRRLLTLEPDNFSSLLEDMSESKRNLIHQAGNSLKQCLSGDGKTGRSILAVALEQTRVWSYERVHKVTYKASEDPDEREPAPNDFSFSQMRDGNTSIYLIIPPEYLSEYRAVLRVMIGFAMRELRTSYTKSKNHPKYQDKPPVLFILDEFPQLAYMSPIEDALSYLAGYGVRLWFFVQDISQLQLHYKNSWRSFLANTGTQCFFGVSDIETAKLVSEMTGTTTIEHSSYTSGLSESYSYGYSHGLLTNHNQTSGTNFSRTSALAARPLITPDEVMRMSDRTQIIFMKGLKPIYCHLPKYYEFLDLDERSKIPPPKEIDFN
jgi:type IV secretion system protein VirD4